MLVTGSVLGDLIALLITLSVLPILWIKWIYGHWARRKIRYLEPVFPYGNLQPAIKGKESRQETLRNIHLEMKRRKWGYGGIFNAIHPSLFITDLEIIRNVLVKDFQYFADRDVYYNEKDPLQAHLINLTGNEWKSLRAKLSPTFTSGKIKLMFNVMAECLTDLEKRLNREIDKGEPIDIKEIVACYTTNVIGVCAFGLDFHALEDENSKFRNIGRIMFNLSKIMKFKRLFSMGFPGLAKFFGVSFYRKETTEFIRDMVQSTIDYREKNGITRNDFMQSLINLKNNKPTDPGDHDGKPLTMNEVGSQCNAFFAAGFETSSTLMSFALYELGKDQDVQDKLRNSINAVLKKNDNKWTYDAVQEMTYLHQVIEEALRMHPPAAQLNRKCVKDYKIPGTDVLVEKGTNVSLSIMGLHYDEEYYPNPEKFDPERFNEENKKTRPNYTYMPFGEGPRNCIGMRFGLLQAKIGLGFLVKNFKFTVDPKTDDPIKYEPVSFVLSVKNGLWLNAERL